MGKLFGAEKFREHITLNCVHDLMYGIGGARARVLLHKLRSLLVCACVPADHISVVDTYRCGVIGADERPLVNTTPTHKLPEGTVIWSNSEHSICSFCFVFRLSVNSKCTTQLQNWIMAGTDSPRLDRDKEWIVKRK